MQHNTIDNYLCNSYVYLSPINVVLFHRLPTNFYRHYSLAWSLTSHYYFRYLVTASDIKEAKSQVSRRKTVKKSAIGGNFSRYASSSNKRKEQLRGNAQPKRALLGKRNCACQNLSSIMISSRLTSVISFF